MTKYRMDAWRFFAERVYNMFNKIVIALVFIYYSFIPIEFDIT